jgi:hypothetical protein
MPLGVAFLLRSPGAECIAGLFVVPAIFVSACFAGYEAIARLIDPHEPKALGALAAAGAVGVRRGVAPRIERGRALPCWRSVDRGQA